MDRGPRAAELAQGDTLLLLAGVTPAVAGLVAAGALVLLGVVGVEQAYRSVSWQSVVLIGGMIPLSSALTESGLATPASGLVQLVGNARPILLPGALFAFVALLVVPVVWPL